MRFVGVLLAITFGVAGICVGQWASQRSSQPSPNPWTHHELSEAQETRQSELLDEIFPSLDGASDSLDGTDASQHKELLSLADRSRVRNNETTYAFNVSCAGDVHDTVEMTIIVVGNKIKLARWPFGEF